MRKIFALSILFLILFLTSNKLFSENIYFSARTTFANSQFWEQNINKDDTDEHRKVFSNFFTGSVGIGMEMIIWDIGKKRGSRIFLKSGIDLAFAGVSYVGAYDENTVNFSMYPLNINGGAFYVGIDWDIFFGGTIPKTDLIWGFGCIFNFLFPAYSPKYDVSNFVEKYAFYAAPCVLFGYDIFIPKTQFKITPQIRAGFTCMPVVPDDLIRDKDTTGGRYKQSDLYSGAYIDFSVAFSFIAIKWKE